jgi:uncharacterized protein (TIGR02118 family)
MIKVVAPALRHPSNRALPEFREYWGETHGPLYANTKALRRYVQHITLPEAYGGNPSPTYDGVSMFWFDDPESQRVPLADPEALELVHALFGIEVEPAADADPDDPQAALLLAVLRDDAQLFDRSTTWPMHLKRASVSAEEVVVVDGETTPEMVKAIFIVSKLPGLTLGEFFHRWRSDHAAVVAEVPGLRRYVQNHALPTAYAGLGQTHDGWAELWFDDLESLHAAAASPEWQAAREDAAMMFAEPYGVGVARERVQKDLDWSYDDFGAGALDEDGIRARLESEGYAELAADPGAPAKIAAAAAAQRLGIWTDEHLVTFDESRIDARPSR